MKLFPLSLPLLCLLALSPLCVANETLILKSGEKVEGTIILEEQDQILIDVNLSPTIVERRTFKTEEIEEIVRPALDEVDFERIANLKLLENSSTIGTYDRVLSEILDPFILKHPESTHLPRVEELREAFNAERTRVAAGEVKLDGRWLEAEEVEKRRTEIDARVAFNSMREAASRGDNIATLNAFDVIERDFKGQLIYPDAVVIAQSSLNALARDVPRLIEAHGIELEEWKAGVERTRETRRPPLIDARAQEEASYEARIARASASGERWPPLISRSMKSLEDIQRLGMPESTRLQGIDVNSLRASAEKSREAQASAADNQYERAGGLADEALLLWPENAVAKNLQAELPALLKAHEEGVQAALEAKEVAKAEAAAVEVEAQAGQAAAALQAGQATAAQASQPATLAASEKKPFFMTIQGAIAIVVLVLVVVTGSALVSKMRNKPSRDIEA